MNEKLTQLLNQENVDPTVANRASDELRALFEEQDARQRLAQNILNEGLRCAVRPPVHFQPSPDRLLPHSFWQTLFSQPGKTYVDTASGFEGCWEPESQHVRLSVHIDGRIEEAYIWLERSPVSNDGDVTHVVATAEAKRLLGRAGLAYLS